MLDHLRKQTFLQQQLIRGTYLYNAPCIHHDNSIVTGHSVQPMSDCDDSAVVELGPDAFLDKMVSLHVHIGCGFI